jgi:hypothetical protein
MASAKAVSFELDDRKIRTLHPAFFQDTVCPKAVESLSASSLNWSLQPSATEPAERLTARPTPFQVSRQQSRLATN